MMTFSNTAFHSRYYMAIPRGWPMVFYRNYVSYGAAL